MAVGGFAAQQFLFRHPHWRDLTVLKAVSAKVIPRYDALLDDDCGLFVSGSEFVTISAENPGNGWWLGGHYA